ncbi:MAG: bifunctional methylenetetrahydrofolate dehydrogenase/methenyltetrahydrofolate cyclohydrolase FolD [Paludibacteraceae bacterium]|nr:bifunctional methylenetetrahydrofolate dehydrogenase/methenyltetrahydrofolate cyclohydrolase FolD [Paludibacteraceae bacterium]
MIIDGKKLSQSLKDEMKLEVEALARQYGRKPCPMVILVGDNPASRSYVRGKIKATEYCGFDGTLVELPEDCSEQTLLDEIHRLNNDSQVDGILVQLPLPKHISEDKVIAAIAPEKDVDGFHPANVAKLWLNDPTAIVPCTPKGIIVMLEKAGIELAGKKAVVVGRSNIVGKPVAKLLLDKNCTVTIAHSRTVNLPAVCREADILVAAVGKPLMLTADYIRPGATVIDVGINRIPDSTATTGYRLVGDVDYEAAKEIAGAITPVPGGVGPMTITMLMRNTIQCFIHRQNQLHS